MFLFKSFTFRNSKQYSKYSDFFTLTKALISKLNFYYRNYEIINIYYVFSFKTVSVSLTFNKSKKANASKQKADSDSVSGWDS